MKRILGIAVVLGLIGALSLLAQEVKPGKTEVIDLGRGGDLEMVLIPAGKFRMGMGLQKKETEEYKVAVKKIFLEDPKNSKKKLGMEELDLVEKLVVALAEERRQHEVTLTKPFYMGKYEVTQEQWEALMNANPSDTKGAKLPVTVVSWEDCQEFIKKLNAKTDGGYRLPTEAEWEYSCRAGTTTAYSFGDEITPNEANYKDSKIGKPVAVGSYKPNAFGLYDMYGNVCEWCEDWHGDYPFAVTDPKGPTEGKDRVLRGGNFKTPVFSDNGFFDIPKFEPKLLASGSRDRLAQTDGYSFIGLRLARTIK